MKNLMLLRRLFVVGVLAVVGLAMNANDAFATHFRYGTMTWQVANPAQPNIVTIRFDSVWRWSYPYGPGSVSLCPPGFVPTGPSGGGSCPTLGTVLPPLGQIIVRNASNTQVAAVNLTPTVNSINSTEDWFSATYQGNVTLPLSNANYTAQFQSSARISTLAGGNADQAFIINAGIQVRVPPSPVNQPPTTGMLPIVVLARNQATTLQIPATDPNADPLTFRLSTTAESGLVQIAPPGLTLSASGAVQWTPTTNGLYALQIRVTDAPGAFSVVDLIFQVKDAVGQPPIVRINGSAAPQSLSVVRGNPVTFTVAATDPENKPVMLSSNSMPLGAVMTPSLPMTAVNPSSTFTWTPNTLGTYVVSFAGLDGDGRQASNSMTLIVTNILPTIVCTAAGPVLEATSPLGGLFSISANVDDADQDQVTVQFFVDGVLRQGSPLLTPPVVQSYSGTFPLGHHTYAGRAGDGISNSSCFGAFDVVDTTAPSIVVTPGDQTLTAVSPAGAPAVFTVTTHDDVDPAPVVTCSWPSGSTFPIGTTSVTCTATDASGNHAPVTFIIDVTDSTPPLVTPQVTGTLGTNGWYVSDVAVNWVTVDPESGVASTSGCDSQVVSADTAGVTFTCSATNSDGVSSDPVSVTIKRDATAPALVFTPASIVAEASSAAGAAVAFDAASASDTLSGLSGAVSCSHASGATFPIGPTTVTCAATDNAGNTGFADLLVTVADTTAPTIDPHGNETADATSAAGAIVSYALPATHDAVDGSGTATCSPAPGTFPIGTAMVTCSAVDAHGNAAAHTTFTVTVVDTPPVIDPHGDESAEATSAAGAAVSYLSPATHDVVDGDGTAACSPASGTTFALGTSTVTCSTTDTAGHHVAASFTVTVVDTTPPTIDAHADLSVPATSAAGALVTYLSPATHDAVDGDGVATCSPASGTFPIGTTTVTCSAVDAHGNPAADTTFTVTVVDTPPIIDPHGDESAEATSASGAAVSYLSPATHDAVDGDGTAACSPASGTTFALGTSTVTCSTTDTAGHHVTTSFTVTVVDTTPPTIDAHADLSVPATSAAGAPVTYLSPATHDAVDGEGTATCTPASGTFPIGATTVTCSAVDAHGNPAADTTFTVTVVDTPPVIDPHGDESAEATSASGAAVSYLSPATHDAVDGDGTAVCSPGSGATFPLGASTVTCSTTDAAGHHVTTSFTVTVVDTTPPTIEAHADLSVPATSTAGAPVTYLSPATHDAVDGEGTATCTPASAATFPLGMTTVTCAATDVNGNHAVATTFTVTVTNNPPTFTPPSDITTEATGPLGTVVSYAATGSDVESGTLPAACSPPSGMTFPVGTTTVSCTVTDVAGATASGSFSVTVTDHTAPVLHLPADMVVHPTGPGGAVVTYTATATDMVDVSVAVTCAPASGSTFAIGTTTVSCSATDAHGNVSTGSFDVTVTNTPPMAKADTYTGQWNTLLTVPAKGVLTNDTDADGDALSATLVAGPAHGTLTLNADGRFTYMPAPNYYGTDSFTYQASDGRGGVSGVATVTLTITTPCPSLADHDRDHDRDHYFGRDENHDYHSHDYSDSDCGDRGCTPGTPIAANDTFKTKQATTLTVPARGVLVNDGRYAATVNLITPPANGTVTLAANGGFVYVPAPGFYGIDTFVYVARTSAGVAGPVATVRIIVNKNLAPDAGNDFYSTGRNTTLTVSAGNGVLSDDSDPNGDALTAILVSGPAHGTLTLNANGSFVYQPAMNYAGVDTFVYRAKDPLGLEDSATATIRVGVWGGYDGHSRRHHDDDGCDHEQHRNGHFGGDGCEHDRIHNY